MNGKIWIGLGAVFAALAVGLGAFGAHGLEQWVEKNIDLLAERDKRLDNWAVATRYLFYHAFGFLFLGLSADRMTSGYTKAAGVLFFIGNFLFAGFLYGWVLTGEKSLVMIVPAGGVAYIIGWLVFAIGILRYGQDVQLAE